MPEKAKELNNRKDGDRNSCPICHPRQDRVTMSQLWAFVRRTGELPFRGQVRGNPNV